MGLQLDQTQIKGQGHELFMAHLQQETDLLKQWFVNKHFADNELEIGLEIEFWLRNQKMRCAHQNLELIAKAKNDILIEPEVMAYSAEIQSDHYPANNDFLNKLGTNLHNAWHKCISAAEKLDLVLLLIGTPPDLCKRELHRRNITDVARFKALNQRVIELHNKSYAKIDIQGRDHLRMKTQEIQLAATTAAFQIHIKVGLANSHRYYNAAQICLAPLTAIAANSPFFLRKQLWDETRIPLFEQTLVTKTQGKSRALFGDRYIDSMYDLYSENIERFSFWLDVCRDAPLEEMWHLRLHNGTIYRWNRPVIGFEDGTDQPHLRIEMRTIPTGPTINDMLANAAFFIGLTHKLTILDSPPETNLLFTDAKQNFYQAAEHGLQAPMTWLKNKKTTIQNLMLDELLPLAESGLQQLGITQNTSKKYLNTIEKRAQNQQTGSQWQQQFMAKRGRKFIDMLKIYRQLQYENSPVHEWPVS